MPTSVFKDVLLAEMRALVDSRRCSPTYYSCKWKALSQNSHRVSEPPEKHCWVFGFAWNSVQISWLITSVDSFSSETWSVMDDSEFIHYSLPLGLGTDQYTGPSKATGVGCWGHWLLGKRTKSHWETGMVGYQLLWWWTHALQRRSLCVFKAKDTSLDFTIGNAYSQGHIHWKVMCM